MTAQTRKIRLIMKLRRSGVPDTNVLSAIERVPREEFIPPLFMISAMTILHYRSGVDNNQATLVVAQ